ncbi:MAG: DUF3786 domain-containing protein [Anaerolineales bacterium]
MSKPPASPSQEHLIQRIEQLRRSLSPRDPKTLSQNTGAPYEALDEHSGVFHVPVWNQPLTVSYPGFVPRHPETGQAPTPPIQALLMYYFATADGAPLAGQWISFSELPDGKFYQQAFQGYTGAELGRTFQNDKNAFIKAATRLGGEAQPLGDAAFSFLALPRVPVLAVLWQGDEDFPASYRILFDQSAPHYLPADVYAIVGSMLTRRLIGARQA